MATEKFSDFTDGSTPGDSDQIVGFLSTTNKRWTFLNVAAYLVSKLITLLFPSSIQTTITGTSAGTAIIAQIWRGTAYKEVIVWLNGYENTTGSPQTYALPVAFAHTPLSGIEQVDPPVAFSTTTVTLPSSMSGPVTGWAIAKGF